MTQVTATILGRGHGGTRLAASALMAAGFYMGDRHNDSNDMLPLGGAYEAAKIAGRQVRHLGGCRWDFSALHTGPIDPAWTRHMETFLAPILNSNAVRRGWKLPETILSFPWLARAFPDVRYVWWIRDPRDAILRSHVTDDLRDFDVPCEAIGANDAVQVQRAHSWIYQFQIVQSTIAARDDRKVHLPYVLDLRFEDYVLRQDAMRYRLGGFVETLIPSVPTHSESVGRWRQGTPCDPRAVALLQPYLEQWYLDMLQR